MQETVAEIALMFYNFLQEYPDWKIELKNSGLVNLKDLDPSIMVQLAYSTVDNILGYDAYGSLDDAYLREEAAVKLEEAQKLLKVHNPNLRLYIFDAARPRRIQQQLWDNSDLPVSERSKYIANPERGSIHNFGMAVDLGIYDIDAGLLDMGTKFDDFTEVSHITKEDSLVENGLLTNNQLTNRKLLREIMVAAGFQTLATEWWHFDAMERSRTKELFSIIE